VKTEREVNGLDSRFRPNGHVTVFSLDSRFRPNGYFISSHLL